MMNIDLSGKRALVTGASSGLGQAMALKLAEAGADVAVHHLHDPDAAQAVASEVKKHGGKALTVSADVSDAVQVTEMFDQVDVAWGGLDILISNAGVDGRRAMTWDIEPKDWEQVLRINLFGGYYCGREALRRMVPNKSGVILYTTSVHQVIAWSGYSAYTASKAGLGMLMKSMAQEAAPHGVRVLAIAPGAIKTQMNKSVWSDPKMLADLNDKIPMDRIGEPQEIGRMAVVLVSDAASYITGTTIYVDGGMTDYPSFEHGG